MPTHADTVRTMPARRPRKPGPKKGAANAGRPERPGQVVLQLRASAAAVAAFDAACEDVYRACRSDVLRWLLEDLASGHVALPVLPTTTLDDEMRLTLRLPEHVAAHAREVAAAAQVDVSAVVRGAMALGCAGTFVPHHLAQLVARRVSER